MDILKKPMDTAGFFTKICDILTEKEKMPDILDYAIPGHNNALMTTTELEFKNNLDYGNRACFSYYCENMEEALYRKDQFLANYPEAVIINNAARNKKFYI